MSEEPPEPQQAPNYARQSRPSRAAFWVFLAGVALVVGSYAACTIGFPHPTPAPTPAYLALLFLAGLVACPAGGVPVVVGCVLWARNRR